MTLIQQNNPNPFYGSGIIPIEDLLKPARDVSDPYSGLTNIPEYQPPTLDGVSPIEHTPKHMDYYDLNPYEASQKRLLHNDIMGTSNNMQQKMMMRGGMDQDAMDRMKREAQDQSISAQGALGSQFDVLDSDLRNQVDLYNTGALNDAQEFNIQNRLQDKRFKYGADFDLYRTKAKGLASQMVSDAMGR